MILSRISPGTALGVSLGVSAGVPLISDVHEWMNEIPSVPIYYLTKQQLSEKAWKHERGNKTYSRSSSAFI